MALDGKVMSYELVEELLPWLVLPTRIECMWDSESSEQTNLDLENVLIIGQALFMIHDMQNDILPRVNSAQNKS
jgi:hypothetical protein